MSSEPHNLQGFFFRLDCKEDNISGSRNRVENMMFNNCSEFLRNE